ncbi:hypothetical protein BGM26_19415 [Bacillus sp. FJAT-29790]|uniref:hypothetical protein n=1 Tax=Bacillus sp. FJAT-29790 TaxID=1895002 RepID=UPI001C24C971|nr:hypothetical protein [Bacillus sp. FJAT-29790]MBU8881095.1 hypothetical protein [Bacillus sp. FJAT-29790]
MINQEESEIAGSLYFKGAHSKGNYLSIHHQPSFFDALQLTKPQESKPYQRIPLSKNTSLIFQYTENCLKKSVHYKFDLKNGSIQIKEADNQAEHRFLSCFLIKEGKRVTYMAYRPNCPEKAKIKNQPPTIVEYKRIEG